MSWLSQNVYLDRCEKPVEGLWPVVCEDDDPEGGDGGQEGGADDGVTQGDGGGGHQVHGHSSWYHYRCRWSASLAQICCELNTKTCESYCPVWCTKGKKVFQSQGSGQIVSLSMMRRLSNKFLYFSAILEIIITVEGLNFPGGEVVLGPWEPRSHPRVWDLHRYYDMWWDERNV